ELEDRAGLGALGLGETGESRDVAGTFGKPETIEGGPGAGLRAHAPNVAHHGYDALGAVELYGIAGEAQRLRGRRDRCFAQCNAKGFGIDSLANGTRHPFDDWRRQPPSFLSGLDDRQAGARRRGYSDA